MIGPTSPARGVALTISATLHVVVIAGLLALWPAAPEYAPGTRDARTPRAREQQRPLSRPGPRARSTTAARPAQPAPMTAAAPDTPLVVIPMMVVRATSSVAGRVLNHLWQSTLFAVLIGGLTVMFRRNDARVRYWMWFAVVLKFLLPFSLLEAVGASLLGPSITALFGISATASPPATSVPLVLTQISQPFTAAPAFAGSSAVASGGVEWTPIVVLLAWAFGVEFVVMQRLRAWRVVRAAVRASRPAVLASAHVPTGTPIRFSPAVLEPAVVGMWRPILLLPDGIDERLTPAELDAVLAHEACHISCRDNLTAAVQMLVECVFWFHPLVWWIGGRLIQERERACDEHVLGLLQNPRVYADGIINVCKLYVGAPLPCAPGVSSSDLRQRIERIMRNETGHAVSRRTRTALGIAASVSVLGPIFVGAATAPVPVTPLQTPRPMPQTSSPLAFEAVSVKQNVSDAMFPRIDVRAPGRFTAINVPAAFLVRFAYGLEDFEVTGAPRWLESERYDVVASAGGDVTMDQKRAMLRQVLQDRFKLSAHSEQRQLPTYALMLARADGKFGPGLHRSFTDCGATAESALAPDTAILRWIGSDSPAWAGMPTCGFFGPSANTNLPAGRGGLSFRGLTMASLAKTLARLVHRSVTDDTKLSGTFDGDFGFIEELPPPPPPPGAPNPFTSPFMSIFTVLPEQLGLKLQSSRAPVSVLVIDAVQRPTPD